MSNGNVFHCGRAARIAMLLWAGPKHAGKTTRAVELARTAKQCGFRVAGLLAPSIYRGGQLVGFDAIDLRNEARSSLAVRRDERGDIGPFHFLEEGLSLGRRALDVAATEGADLVIVDEFGRLELASRGWRPAVDVLVRASRKPLLIVVRRQWADAVQEVYGDVHSRVLDATAPDSVQEVLSLLEDNRNARGSACDDVWEISGHGDFLAESALKQNKEI